MHGLVLAGVGIWCFLVALAGGLVGLVLGNIRLPVMLLAGTSPAAAAGANIAVSGIAAAAASITHIRAGRVDWRLVAWMLPPSVVGAVVGGLAASALPANALRIVIGVALLAFGVDLLRPRRDADCPPGRHGAQPPRRRDQRFRDRRARRADRPDPRLAAHARAHPLGRRGADARVGTNLVVGIAVGVAGLIGHLPGGIDWTLLWVGAAASVPGALIGSRLTGRLSAAQLLRAVGVILLVAGTASILPGIF